MGLHRQAISTRLACSCRPSARRCTRLTTKGRQVQARKEDQTSRTLSASSALPDRVPQPPLATCTSAKPQPSRPSSPPAPTKQKFLSKILWPTKASPKWNMPAQSYSSINSILPTSPKLLRALDYVTRPNTRSVKNRLAKSPPARGRRPRATPMPTANLSS